MSRPSAQTSGVDDTMYMLIVQSLSSISEQERQKLRIKFNIVYFIATEQLAYQKYPKLCELQTKLGMNLGSSYLNENAAKEFIHFMAKLKLQSIISSVQSATFFSLLMDGSTDSSNSENEMILVMWCNVESDDCKIHTKMAYLSMHTPVHTNAEGLFESLKHGLQQLGISSITQETCSRLVGVATDGASSNIAANGLRGLVTEHLPWVVWMWCLAHRAELAINNALSGTFFALIDDMLLRLSQISQKVQRISLCYL